MFFRLGGKVLPNSNIETRNKSKIDALVKSPEQPFRSWFDTSPRTEYQTPTHTHPFTLRYRRVNGTFSELISKFECSNGPDLSARNHESGICLFEIVSDFVLRISDLTAANSRENFPSCFVDLTRISTVIYSPHPNPYVLFIGSYPGQDGGMGMRFEALVETSERLRATPGKKKKRDLLAELLESSKPGETRILAHYLTGSVPGGRIGVGWKTIQGAVDGLPVKGTVFSLRTCSATCRILPDEKDPGSAERKSPVLRSLFGELGEKERAFLTGPSPGRAPAGCARRSRPGCDRSAVAGLACEPRPAGLHVLRRHRRGGRGRDPQRSRGARLPLSQLFFTLFRLCSPILPRTKRRCCGDSVRLRGNTRSTGPGSRSTRAGRRCGSTRGSSRTSPRGSRRSWRWPPALPAKEAVFEGEVIALRAGREAPPVSDDHEAVREDPRGREDHGRRSPSSPISSISFTWRGATVRPPLPGAISAALHSPSSGARDPQDRDLEARKRPGASSKEAWMRDTKG